MGVFEPQFKLATHHVSVPRAFSGGMIYIPRRASTHITTTLLLNILFCNTLKNSGILNSLTVTFNIRVIREKPSSSFSWTCQGKKGWSWAVKQGDAEGLHCHFV